MAESVLESIDGAVAAAVSEPVSAEVCDVVDAVRSEVSELLSSAEETTSDGVT